MVLYLPVPPITLTSFSNFFIYPPHCPHSTSPASYCTDFLCLHPLPYPLLPNRCSDSTVAQGDLLLHSLRPPILGVKRHSEFKILFALSTVLTICTASLKFLYRYSTLSSLYISVSFTLTFICFTLLPSSKRTVWICGRRTSISCIASSHSKTFLRDCSAHISAYSLI